MSETTLDNLNRRIDLLEYKIDLILKHLNIDFYNENDKIVETNDDSCSSNQENVPEIITDDGDITPESEAETSAIDLSFLRNEINSLKSFFKD